MISAYYQPVLLGLALMLTLYTRFAGLSRSEVDFVLAGGDTGDLPLRLTRALLEF